MGNGCTAIPLLLKYLSFVAFGQWFSNCKHTTVVRCEGTEDGQRDTVPRGEVLHFLPDLVIPSISTHHEY
jgi:hypothetical protein